MLKKIIYIIAAVLCAAVLYFLFFTAGDSIVFDRTDLKVKTTLKADEYPLEPDGGGEYLRVGNENITLKTKIIRIDGEKKINVTTSLKGDLKVYFNIKKLSDESSVFLLDVINPPESDTPIKRFSDFGNIVTVCLPFTKKGDNPLVLRFKGKADVAVSSPIFYSAKQKNKGNYIFLISADTLRADHLETYGYDKKISPNITEFAKDAVVFDRCFANSPWTLPSHLTLFTGMDVHTLGVFSKFHKLPSNIRMLNELLMDRFPTISYNGGVFIAAKYGFYRGFDFYKTIMFPPPSDVLFKAAVRFLENTEFSNLFAFLHTYQTHAPYNLHSSMPHSEQMRKKGIEKEVKDFFKVLPNHMLGGTPFIYKPLDDRMRDNITNVYDGDVEFLDHWFGYFIKELKRMGIYRRSMIIFLSDHGEEFFDHGGWDHGHTLYNELIRVALIIKFPEEIYKGKRIAANVSLKDVFPTLLEYLGIEPTERVDGRSFMDVIRGDDTSNSRGIISVLKRRQARFTPEKVAVIKKNLKLIYNHAYSEELLEYFGENPPPPYTEYELYDIEQDFAEKNNLITDKKFFNTFRTLQKDIQLILKLIEQREKGDFEKVKISEKEMERLKSLGYL